MLPYLCLCDVFSLNNFYRMSPKGRHKQLLLIIIVDVCVVCMLLHVLSDVSSFSKSHGDMTILANWPQACIRHNTNNLKFIHIEHDLKHLLYEFLDEVFYFFCMCGWLAALTVFMRIILKESDKLRQWWCGFRQIITLICIVAAAFAILW